MSRARGAALFLALALLFFIANRAAYQGWFNDDDLDNLARAARTSAHENVLGLLSPRFGGFNDRPLGHAYYQVLAATAGLEYGWYIGVLHALHLFNCWLVWLLARRLGASARGAAAGTLLFAFHMACFDAYWKPMFVFDVVATTFVLLALLAYLRDRWLLALIAFWLACKGKEIAVTLPAVLLLYEWMLGERRQRRVAPFAVLAILFSVQGLVHGASGDHNYTLRFTPAAVWQTLRFYASNILLAPWALPLLASLAWTARARFGLVAIPILLGPLWFLPGRMFAVYLYLPLIGLAVALAFASEKWKPAWVVVFFAFWLPWNYQVLRENRKLALSTGPENRVFVHQMRDFVSQNATLKAVLYDGGPAHMNRWGVVGALRWFYRDPAFETAGITDPEAEALKSREGYAVLSWDRARQRLLTAAHRPGEPDAPYLDMREGMRAWQYGEGWYAMEGGFRWMQPVASATLRRPAGAREFEVRVNLGTGGRVEMEVLIDGQSLGSRVFEGEGWHAQRWQAPAGEEGTVQVELRVAEAHHAPGDPRLLGAAVGGFGFVE